MAKKKAAEMEKWPNSHSGVHLFHLGGHFLANPGLGAIFHFLSHVPVIFCVRQVSHSVNGHSYRTCTPPICIMMHDTPPSYVSMPLQKYQGKGLLEHSQDVLRRDARNCQLCRLRDTIVGESESFISKGTDS